MTGRQKIDLDPDIVRVAERGNPPLQGNYALWVGPPPSTVTIFGLISRPGKQPFTPGRDVASYLSDQSLLSGADRRTTRGWFTRRRAKSAGGLLEQASRRADARQHYLCWPRGLRLE